MSPEVSGPLDVFASVSDDGIPEALIADIETDKSVALNSLKRPDYQKFMADSHFQLS